MRGHTHTTSSWRRRGRALVRRLGLRRSLSFELPLPSQQPIYNPDLYRSLQEGEHEIGDQTLFPIAASSCAKPKTSEMPPNCLPQSPFLPSPPASNLSPHQVKLLVAR